jgi:hypothetical protein
MTVPRVNLTPVDKVMAGYELLKLVEVIHTYWFLDNFICILM